MPPSISLHPPTVKDYDMPINSRSARTAKQEMLGHLSLVCKRKRTCIPSGPMMLPVGRGAYKTSSCASKSSREFMNIADSNVLANCPVRCDHIKAADDIFGPNIGSLKGKTVSHPGMHVSERTEGIPRTAHAALGITAT